MQLLSASRAPATAHVQRAPGDDRGDPRHSGMAHGPTLDSAGGVATSPTLPGGSPAPNRGDPRRSGMAHGPTLDSAGGVATGPTLPGGASGAAPASTPGSAGGGSSVPDDAVLSLPGAPTKPTGKGPAPVRVFEERDVAEAYQQNPSRVHRAINYRWYNDILNYQNYSGDEYPTAVLIGGAVVVAPDYDGAGPPKRTTPIEEPDEDGKLGPNDPIPGDPRHMQGPVRARPDLTDPKAKRAIFPGSRRGDEPGMKEAVPVTHDEVMQAYRQNPASVHPSDTDEWHDQVFAMDRGKGQAPRAYRSGNTIIVDPSYPLNGRPPDSSPRGSVRQPGPGSDLGTVLNGAPGQPRRGRTATPAKAGTGPAAAGQPGGPAVAPPVPGKPTATGSSGGKSWKHDVDVTKGAPGVKGEHMLGTETTEGDTTTKKGKGATWGVGGGNVAQVGGQQVESTTVGDATTTNKKAASLTLKPDGSAVLGTEKSRATYKGTDEHGQPIKTGETKTNKSIGLSEKGLTGAAGAERETAGGHKIGASGSITADSKGNISAEGSVKFESKGGTSLTPSVSGGTTVEASDPTPTEGGGFDVAFTVTDSAGASLALGKQFGGGPSIGLSGGATGATLNTGSKHFETEEKAKEFRDHAAKYIAAEALLARPPVNTVEGALAIPIGEERGTGEMEGTNWGVSGSLEGATVSYGRSQSTTHQFKVRHMHDKVVQVTGSVVGTKASEAGISGGVALGRGGSNTHGFEVVWEIDLGDKAGRNAFEVYAKAGLPPLAGKLVSMTSTASDEDHDSVSIPLLGTAKWTGATWEIIREDATGRHAQFGGKQSHDQDPSWTGKHILGQDTIHSNSQITSKLDTDKDGKQTETYEAEITVSGTTGDETRKELGQIWMGVPHDGEAKASGEWTLTGQVSAEVVHDLEKVNKAMREAPTKEDKMRVYSALVKERGIKMVGAQVGLGGDPLAWNVELKGDKNFPGNAGRAALEGKRSELKGKLKDPAAAKSVLNDAQTTLDLLRARRIAVADKKRYTDLPDGLRDQQLKMIDKHIGDFEFIRHAALKAAVRGETPAKTDAAKPGSKPGDAAGGYKGDTEAAENADMVKLRTQIGEKSDAVSRIDSRNDTAIKAVMKADERIVKVPPVYSAWVSSHFATYQAHWHVGISINERQSPMGPKIDALRQRLLEAIFHVDQKAAAEELLKLLTDRLGLLESLHTEVISAAEALKPILTERAASGFPRFWASIKGDPAPWTDEGVGTNDD